MEFDDKLLEGVVLALSATFNSNPSNAWKGFDFQAMNRLHEHGFISDSMSEKNRSS